MIGKLVWPISWIVDFLLLSLQIKEKSDKSTCARKITAKESGLK